MSGVYPPTGLQNVLSNLLGGRQRVWPMRHENQNRYTEASKGNIPIANTVRMNL